MPQAALNPTAPPPLIRRPDDEDDAPSPLTPAPTSTVAPASGRRRSVLEQAGIPAPLVQAIQEGVGRVQQSSQAAQSHIADLRTQQGQIRQSIGEIPHTPVPETEKLPDAPPTQKPTDTLRVFGQVLPVLAMFGGLFVRNNSAAALQAGAAAMNAARTNDQTALEQAHQQWMDHLNAIRARNQDVLQRWNAIADNEHMSREDKLAEFNAIAAEIQSTVLQQQVAAGELGPLMQSGEMYQNAHNQLVTEMQAQERINMQREAMAATGPDAVEYAAEQFRISGVMPAVGSGPAAAALRSRILSRAAELARESGNTGESDRIQQAAFQANRSSMAALTRQRTLVQSFERTAEANLRLVQRLSREVPRSDYPLLNRAILTGQLQGGSPETAAYFNALIGARTEYAKVLSGATGAAGLTDAGRREAEEMFSQYASPDQLDALIQTARTEMDNRMRAFDEQEAYLRQQMSGGMDDEAPARPQGVPESAHWNAQDQVWEE